MRSWELRPAEIVVVASEIQRREVAPFRNRLIQLAESSDAKLGLITSSDRATAGVNRNTGWAQATYPWTVFLDADDVYRPERTRYLLDLCQKMEAQAVLHSFAYLETPNRFLRGSPIKGPGQDVLLGSSLQGDRSTISQLRSARCDQQGASNLDLPTHGPSSVHHGHLTVRTELREDFHFEDIPFGEDGILARSLVASSIRFLVTPWILSLYDPWRWNLPIPELLRNAKRKSSKLVSEAKERTRRG